MISLFLKPFLAFITAGGILTGGYFIYRHSNSKKTELKTGEVDGNTSEADEKKDTGEEVVSTEGEASGSTGNLPTQEIQVKL